MLTCDANVFPQAKYDLMKLLINFGFNTGKSMSEALIFASTNPQYDNTLFIELPVQ